MQKCTIHVACLLFMAFYMYPISKKNKGNPKWYDYLLAVIGFGCAIYVAFRFDPDFAKFGVSNPIDTVMAALTVVLILEAARRTLGPIIPIISIILYYMHCFLLICRDPSVSPVLLFPGLCTDYT